jgi:hypothetical protein
VPSCAAPARPDPNGRVRPFLRLLAIAPSPPPRPGGQEGARAMAPRMALRGLECPLTPACPHLSPPFLRVLPDEQNEFQIGQSRKHWLAPQFGAFPTWRQVAAFCVKAWETEAHSHDGDDLRIVENALTDAKPAAQADARRVGIGTSRGMDTNPRRLAGDANARGRRDLEDGPRLMRESRAISGRVAADAACADVLDKRRECEAVRSRGSELSAPR